MPWMIDDGGVKACMRDSGSTHPIVPSTHDGSWNKARQVGLMAVKSRASIPGRDRGELGKELQLPSLQTARAQVREGAVDAASGRVHGQRARYECL